MKRIFAYLIVAAALAFGASSCIKDVFPEGTDPTPVLESEGIDITVTEVNDNSFKFRIEPKGKASYYSYLVTASPAQQLDSSLLYAVKYSGLAQGTFNAKTNPRYNIEVDELTPNHSYYVYAVAGSLEGNVSPVASVTVKTTDGVAPKITGYERKGNVITLKFSEPVTYVEGKEISANAVPFIFPLDPAEKHVGTVVANGTSADVTFADITQPGTLYVVNVPAGAFIDSVGQGTQAIESSILEQDKDGNPVFAPGSIYGRVAAGEIEVDDSVVPATVVDWKDAIPLFKCKTAIAMVDKDAVVAKIIHEEEDKTVTTEYYLAANEKYGTTDGYTFVAFLPVEPARGDKILFEVAAGAVVDIYGNESPEAAVGPLLYSYGFTLEDALGTYPASGLTILASKQDEPDWAFVLSESLGNIMISEYMGLPCQIYGEFDGDAGTLAIDMDFAYINSTKENMGVDVLCDYYTISYYVDFVGEERPVTFQFTAPGTISAVDDYIGYYIDVYLWPESGNLDDIDEDADYLGAIYNVFWNTSFERAEEESETGAPACIAAPKASHAPKAHSLAGTLIK